MPKSEDLLNNTLERCAGHTFRASLVHDSPDYCRTLECLLFLEEAKMLLRLGSPCIKRIYSDFFNHRILQLDSKASSRITDEVRPILFR